MKFILIILVLCSGVIFAEEYKITFNTTFEKGQKFKIEIKANLEEESKIILDGKTVQDKNSKIKLEGSSKIEILEVDSNGFAKKIKMTIDSLKANDVEVVAVNSEVVGELGKDDNMVFAINNTSVKAEISKYLGKIISIKNRKMPTDQECFGSAKPVKAGETWEINKDFFKKGLAEKKLQTSENFAIKGVCKLDQVNKVNGIDHLSISCDLSFNGIEIPLPGKMMYEKSEVTMKFSAIIPNGNNKNRVEEKEESKFEIKASGEINQNNNTNKMEIQIKTFENISRKFIY